MNKTQILTSILFALMILVVFVQSSSHHGDGMPQIQLSIHTLMSAAGVFVSGGAALGIFCNTLAE